MINRFKESPDLALQIYGEVIYSNLTNFSRLESFHVLEDKDGFWLQEYKRRFRKKATAIIYTLGSFVFLRDEVSNIVLNGETKKLSLYVYYISAVKHLGDAMDYIKSINLNFLEWAEIEDKDKHKRELKNHFHNYLEYPKEYRNYLSHGGFGIFGPNCMVPVLSFDIISNKKPIEIFERYNINQTREWAKADEFLNRLYNDVTIGIDLQSKYLLDECLIPNFPEGFIDKNSALQDKDDNSSSFGDDILLL